MVVENIVERLSAPPEENEDRLGAVNAATADVIVPVSAGIAIIALVFLPLLSLEGLEGKLFAPVALTIVFALAGSLVLALAACKDDTSVSQKAGSAISGTAATPNPASTKPIIVVTCRVSQMLERCGTTLLNA